MKNKATISNTDNEINIEKAKHILESIKKDYNRRKTFKHLKKCKKYKDTLDVRKLYITVISGYPDLKKDELELFYETLISMPPEASCALESIWYKYYKHALGGYITNIKEHMEVLHYTKSLHKEIYDSKITNSEIEKEIGELEDDIRIREDIIDNYKKELRDRDLKFGKYPIPFKEIISELKSNPKKYDTEISREVFRKHVEEEDIDNINQLYFECREDFNKAFKRFHNAFRKHKNRHKLYL